jgi:hypothetical protein
MRNYIVPILAVLTVGVVAGCGSKNEQAGTPCSVPDDCYPDVQDKTKIMGQVVCLTQYPNGYCTHRCTVDTDCCAVSGECRTGFKQVCSSFENQPDLYCLVSCADADIAASPNEGTTDPTAYCQKFAGSTLTCRSSGGGSLNRKFCG